MYTSTFEAPARQALAQRILDILLRPLSTWTRIDSENGSAAHVYRSYLIYLAAIPAIASFIGLSLVGVGAFGVRIRVPIVAGLVNMVVSYLLSLALVYVMALIANALAPRFQGEQDMGSALKLIAYGATAGMLAAAFTALPALAMLGMLGGLYSIYLLYVGAPVLMRVPKERALGYTALLLVCAIVAALVMGGVSSLLTPRSGVGLPGLGSAGPGALSLPGASSSRAEEAAATQAASQIIGAMLGTKVDGSRVEQASRQLERARAQGDDKSAADAAGAMVSAVMGRPAQAAFSAQQLRAVAPEQLAGLPRTAIKAEANTVMGMAFTQVKARYSQERKHVELSLKDMGSTLAMGMAGWANGSSESEDEREIERSYKKSGVSFREKYRKDGSYSELSVLLPNHVALQASGSLSIDALKQALQPLVQQATALARVEQ